MKVFRKIGEPAHFQAVRHDGPHALAPGVLNSFTSGVPVNAGDFLGIHVTADVGTACTFQVPGEPFSNYLGDLADGASAPFSEKVGGPGSISPP